MWFDSWSDILRVLLVGAAAYLTLVAVLRVSGKRTLAKLNAFDLVVTVALGSTLATILLTSTVSWAEGHASRLLTLAACSSWSRPSTSRVPAARRLVTARPTYLVRDGVVLESALRSQRVTVERGPAGGRGERPDRRPGRVVAAVVLETDGSLSVIGRTSTGDGWALGDVRRAER